MNMTKIHERAIERAARVCGELLTVQKSAGGAGLAPDVSRVIGELCVDIETALDVNKRMAKAAKRSSKLLRKHAKAARKVGPLSAQVAQMQSHLVGMNDPGEWRVKLERAAAQSAAMLNGHGWPQP